MKYNAGKFICCGAAGMIVLASVAGCNSKNDTSASVTSEVRKNTVSTSEETDPYSEPVLSPYSVQWPVKTGSLGDLEYNLQSVTIDFQSKERGFYIFDVEEHDYPVNIIIAAGEFSTGGYDIFIDDMNYDNNTFTVTVREICPEPTDIVTEAFTYPCCEIQLNKLPGSVRVLDGNGNELDCLYFYIDENEIEPGWIAVIEDGTGEFMHKTYVYETVDGQYSYVNVLSTTVNYGSTKWNDVIRGSGMADSKEDIIKAAKEFGSCGFIFYVGDTATIHSVDEFLDN